MLEIRLFGGTTVRTGDVVVGPDELGGVKPRQVLEILALSPGTPVSKARLAELLWDGEPPRSWTGTLESYVCVLRRALRLNGGRGSAVATASRGYVLDADAVWVDLAEFRALRAVRSDDPATALVDLERALALGSGDLFPDEAYATWAAHERGVHLAQLVATATLAAQHALALNDTTAAVRLARFAVARDQLAEDAWRMLMKALAAGGCRSEALRAYFDLRDVLATELGADPDAATQELYLSLLREDASHPSSPPVDGRAEVRMLLSLLREAVAAIPGLQVPRNDRDMVELAANLSGVA